MLREYSWSSHRSYLGKAGAPAWLCTDWLSFFARRRKEGQGQYSRFVDDAFGAVVESPWQRLQGGLALGSEAFLERVCGLIESKDGKEEVRWVSRAESDAVRQEAVRVLAGQQAQRSWQIWVRVVLGGERRIDLAREYGYKDGSAITQILKRLQRAAQTDTILQAKMNALKTQCDKHLSSVKS